MGLAKIRKKTPKPVQKKCKVDLSGFFEEPPGTSVLIFREPMPAEIFGISARMQRLKAHYPEFPQVLLKQVLILAGCYVPDGSDPEGFDPDIAMGLFARENSEMFLYIDGSFLTTFPIAKMLMIEEAGEASTQESKEPQSPASDGVANSPSEPDSTSNNLPDLSGHTNELLNTK